MANLIANGVIAPLCRLSSISHETSGTNALATLVHLSSSGTGSAQQCVEDILDYKGVSRMTEIALSNAGSSSRNRKASIGGGYGGGDSAVEMEWRKRVNYAMALFANITRMERGAIELSGFRMPVEAVPSSTTATANASNGVEEDELGGGGDEKTNEEDDVSSSLLPSKPTLDLLTARFLSTVYRHVAADTGSSTVTTPPPTTTAEELAANHDDPYQNFAAVLMNATQVEQVSLQYIVRVYI